MSLAGAQRVQGMGRKHADAHEEQERNNDIHDATCFVWSDTRRGNVSGVFRPVPKMVSWEPSGPLTDGRCQFLPGQNQFRGKTDTTNLAGYRKEPKARG